MLGHEGHAHVARVLARWYSLVMIIYDLCVPTNSTGVYGVNNLLVTCMPGLR